MKRQQAAHNLIGPHLRIIQFLTSHFTASRLGSPHAQRIFHKLIRTTLNGLKHCAGHPLAREFYFQVVLFGLNVFRYCTGLDQGARWRLKDAILSAGLAWFTHQPRYVFLSTLRGVTDEKNRWSFGGNRLQIKAETRLMTEVMNALHSVSTFFARASGCLQSLTAKQDLLFVLLENEQVRLDVWLYPLDHERRHLFQYGNSGKVQSDVRF